MTQQPATQWYLIYTLLGRQPIQVGPFATEADALTVKAQLQPFLASEGAFILWQGPDAYKV